MTALQDFELVKISDIEIGERFRKEPEKDLDTLAKSIEDVGLLNPVVLTSGLELVAGHRRILAVQSLGYDEIEAHFVHDLDEAARLQGEHDENICRVQMTTGEARACAKARTELLAPEAEKNSKAGKSTGTMSQGSTAEATRTRNQAAVGTGKSGKTIERANEIEKIATNPETPPEVAELATEVLAKVDDDEIPVNTGLTQVKEALVEAGAVTHRGQRKALDTLVKAVEKQALIIEKTFLEDGEPVQNFDEDCTVDDVALGFKDFRAAVARINKVLRAVSGVS